MTPTFYNQLHALIPHFLPGDQNDAATLLDSLRFSAAVASLDHDLFERHRLSAGRFAVLVMLGINEPITRRPSQLAEAIGVTRSTMTGLCDTLERDGYLTRDLDRTDRRSFQVKSTSQGRQMLKRLLEDYFISIAKLNSAFTIEEKMTLSNMLEKLPASLSPRRTAHDSKPTTSTSRDRSRAVEASLA